MKVSYFQKGIFYDLLHCFEASHNFFDKDFLFSFMLAHVTWLLSLDFLHQVTIAS